MKRRELFNLAHKFEKSIQAMKKKKVLTITERGIAAGRRWVEGIGADCSDKEMLDEADIQAGFVSDDPDERKTFREAFVAGVRSMEIT